MADSKQMSDEDALDIASSAMGGTAGKVAAAGARAMKLAAYNKPATPDPTQDPSHVCYGGNPGSSVYDSSGAARTDTMPSTPSIPSSTEIA